MRKAVLVGAVLLCTNVGNLSAQQPPSPDEFCSMFGQIAENVMVSRQEGVASSELLAKYAGHKGETLIYAIITAAYRRELYTAEDRKKQEIEDFRAVNETTCHKNFKRP